MVFRPMMRGACRMSDPPDMVLLSPDPTAASHARRRVAAACAGLPEDVVEDARLLVSELVSNAVQHGSGAVGLVVLRNGGGVRVEVRDEGPELPALIEADSLTESGAGLRVVESLSNSWGVIQHGDGQPGKSVWFELS
jgi:anti-sigma regulatory factor (Ser/Thr protein kinase)